MKVVGPFWASMPWLQCRLRLCVCCVFAVCVGCCVFGVLQIEDGVFEVKATNGDTVLGGEDFDNILQDHIVTEFKKTSGVDLRKDTLAMQRVKEVSCNGHQPCRNTLARLLRSVDVCVPTRCTLRRRSPCCAPLAFLNRFLEPALVCCAWHRAQESEKAKRELDGVKETTIELPYITADASGPKHLKVKVTRSQFENMVQPLIDRSLEPCRKCIKDAGVTTKEISEVQQ